MSKAGPSEDARLDATLATLPAPALPPGLAARIVAQTSKLQQDPRREDVLAPVVSALPVMAAAPVALPARRTRVGGYALAGLALAASLAVVISPRLTQEAPAPQVAERQPIAPSAPVIDAAPSEVTQRPALAVASPAPPRMKAATPAPAPTLLASEDKIVPPDAQAPNLAVTEPAEIPDAVPGQKAPAGQVADAAGPKRPVQGPPAPIFQNGAGVQGMSITGQAMPGPSGPGGAMGPPAGMGGGPGGPR